MEVSNKFDNLFGTITHNVKHEEVNICPICKHGIKPHFLHGYIHTVNGYSYAHAMLLCKACDKAFIKNFKISSNGAKPPTYTENDSPDNFLAPVKVKTSSFSKYIEDVSPQFIVIHNQAETEEQTNLSEIAGMGYRKAIEFLIKDYILKDETDEEKRNLVLKKFLANCIKDDVNNENIKIAAYRAVWIGNDETHYIRKYENKDIEDLKRLINLTVRWIEMELMTNEAKDIEYIK